MRRSATKIQLPRNFAQQILDNEIELKLSDKASNETIRKLIELYTLGVQHYESIRSHKYLYFQMKLTELFTNPSTVSSLESPPPRVEEESPVKKKLKSMREEQKIEALKIKQKQERMARYLQEKTKELHTSKEVNSILTENTVKEMQLKEKVKKEIDTQEQKLNQKLQRRKSKMTLSKSFASLDGETETRSSLFVDPSVSQIQSSGSKRSPIIKPIEVSFGNIIKQNQSDDENDGKPEVKEFPQ